MKRVKGVEKIFRYVLIFILILLLVFLYLNFFVYRTCENKTCFDDYLTECHRAQFVEEGDISFGYKIIGKSGEKCVVDVKMLQGDLALEEITNLVGAEMRCEVPFGVVIKPESDLDSCHGPLREGLQNLIVEKLHRYLLQNLGDINKYIQNVSDF